MLGLCMAAILASQAGCDGYPSPDRAMRADVRSEPAQQIESSPKETPVLPQFYRRATKGTSLSEVTLRVKVGPLPPEHSADILIPAPSDFSGQVVVSLKVTCDPPSALGAWKLEKRTDGLNSVISARVTPAMSGATLSYDALVLCPGEAVYRTQISNSKPWLAPSPLVQSGDPEIKAIASKLRNGTKADDDFVRNVVLWVGQNRTGKGEDASADALSALRSGGGSAGRANLCAAILRAARLPARTVSYMPTWATDRIQEQWVTQYWTDDGNWETVDPTVGLLHPARNSLVVLSIAMPADELRPSASGLPYLSVPELPADCRIQAEDRQQINLMKVFPHQFGGRLMTAAHRRGLKVVAAAEHGVSMTLDDNAVLQSIAKNPGNLAFLFDRN